MAAPGDVYPFIAIGKSLRRRGHDVSLLAAAPFRDKIEHAGLSFIEAGTKSQYDELVQEPDLFHPTRGARIILRRFGKSWPLAYAFLTEHLRQDTVLVTNTMGLAARLVQEKLGTRLVVVVEPRSLGLMFAALSSAVVLLSGCASGTPPNPAAMEAFSRSVARIAPKSFTMVGAGFKEPTGVAVDAEGDVYVADAANKGIYEVSPPFTGATHGTIRKIADSIVVGGIVAGSGGRIYITDFRAGSVVRIEKSGAMTTIASGFKYPHGIAIGPDRDLYVADGGRDHVERIAHNGSVSDVGSTYYDPWAVAVDAASDVYVGFLEGITRVSPDGTTERVAPHIDFVLTSLALDRSNDLYVTDDGGILRIRPDGAVNVIGGPPMVDPWGAALDRSGNLYVSDCDCVGFYQGHGAVWELTF